MAIATMTTKGQITIPKEIRDALGLRPGDRVNFVLGKDGKATLHPMTGKLADLIGILKPKGIHLTIEEIATAIREKGNDVVRRAR